MEQLVRIQDIEAMRRREGIDGVELRQDVRVPGVRDIVRLTLLTGDPSFAGETVLVRVTAVRGTSFRGVLVRTSTAKGLSGLPAGSPLTFSADHIHSLLRQSWPQPNRARARLPRPRRAADAAPGGSDLRGVDRVCDEGIR